MLPKTRSLSVRTFFFSLPEGGVAYTSRKFGRKTKGGRDRERYWDYIRDILGLPRDNGKESENYRDYRGYIRIIERKREREREREDFDPGTERGWVKIQECPRKQQATAIKGLVPPWLGLLRIASASEPKLG